ncbi:putative Bud site selection-related protein [Coemansia reversa NRRL 1564]|uniref:Putative Bud site selection-related protein n=1 Tax=Coemansia reversa (strain ATCC 12441 / NRRL 1564) TaxID=763665 RepID=A0A2G5B2R3_COERN|nr:putative Bud site selection-related protein [Coemansia reversa NRRL 1564]|eukprot:PIA13313.1 putative Bud site selection-related protein [Coemansia reversa NRRL 1564]
MAYNDCLQDVPDIFENEIGEALGMRTESLGMMRELGPPDLCHIVKVHSSNRNEPDIGSYHHVLGVDTSSSASLAAYINSLQYSLNDKTGWFGATNTWKIASGTYCTYNAFSKVDMRVQIKIPGGVDAYAITAQGERKEVSDELWKECHVSAILRSILYADPASYSVTGLRRLTLVVEPREETRMIEALMEYFWNGWRLGSNAETQVASHAHNYLVDGLISYFSGQGRFLDCATDILAPLAYAPLGKPQQPPQAQQNRASLDFKGIDPEVASLLAEAYMNGDEEVQAVRVMHQALKAKPSCYPMLSTQAEFLRRKKQYASARVIALMAVKYAPSEFHAWAELTEVYIDNGDFENALLTLNTCPMYTYVDRDYPRVPTPRRINYPVKSDVLADYNLGDNFTNGNYGPTSFILRLSAPTLKGTFAHAYKLLTAIASTTGWDDLLQLRSRVFVMEEEYRNSTMPSTAADDEEDDDEDDHIPFKMEDVSLSDGNNEKTPAPAEEAAEQPAEELESQLTAPQTAAPHVRKRLCERWLDNLIMILFDDLRTYTSWRTKMHNLRATGQQVMHQFTQAEWETLGDLALRLHRPSEAREAYEYALSIRFSAKAWLRLLEMYTGTYAAMQKEELLRNDDVIPFAPLGSTDALMMALDAVVWLAVYNDRWYNNMAYPNPLCNHVVKLVNIHGLSKVRNSLISMNLKPAVFNLVKVYLEIAERFDVIGTGW